MFKCGSCQKQTEPGEPLRPIVTEWRVKDYPPIKLPKILGDISTRFSMSGRGYEAAVIKNTCVTCVEAGVKDAPIPQFSSNEFSLRDHLAAVIKTHFKMTRNGTQLTIRYPGRKFFKRGDILDFPDPHAKDVTLYGRIEDARTSDDNSITEVVVRLVPKWQAGVAESDYVRAKSLKESAA